MSEQEETVEVSQVIRGRAAFYEFFSQAMRQPATKEFLKLVTDFIPHFQAVAEETDVQELKEGANGLAAFAETITDTQAYMDKLNSGYTMLFLLGHTSIPTSESVYLSPEKLLKQEPWEAVMALYGKYKLGIPVSFKEPEDHICIELLFMSDLASKCADEFDKLNDELAEELMLAQKNFLNVHMNRWAPEFCNRVIEMTKRANIPLYNAVALLIKGFLKYDTEFVDMVLSAEE
jgi:TorA maturation chaperone TorD